MEKGLKIVRLTTTNVKAITAVEIEPDGNVVVISGKNGAGKSSVLDSILYNLVPSKMPTEPIRKGQKKAVIEIETEGYLIKRTIIRKKSGGFNHSLNIVKADGDTVDSPQKWLNKRIGQLSFDPGEFSRMKPKEQRDILMKVIGADFTDLDTQRQKHFDQRTMVGRERDKAKGHADSIKPLDLADIPDEGVDVAALVQEKDLVQDVIKDYQETEEKLTRGRTAISDKRVEIQKLTSELADMESGAENLQKVLAEGAVMYDNKKERLVKINDDLQNASAINDKVREVASYKSARKEAADKQTEYEALTLKIEDIDGQKEEIIRTAKMPIKGLAFDPSGPGVLFNEMPYDNLCQSEAIRVSTAMAIALNPGLKISRIQDGSLLGTEAMQVITEMAETHDFQVWVEIVDESGSRGIVIEDGMVKDG